MKWLLKGACVLLLCLIAGAGYLLGSEHALQLLVRQLSSLSGGIVAVEKVEGRLLDNWSVDGVSLSLPGVHLSVDHFAWAWQPTALLKGTFSVAECLVSGVQLRFPESTSQAESAQGTEGTEGTEDSANDGEPAVTEADDSAENALEESTAFSLPPLLLPLRIVLGHVALDGFQILDSDGEVLFEVDELVARLSGHGKLVEISELRLDGPEVGFNTHGSLQLGHDWRVDLMGNWRFQDYGFHPLHGTFSVQDKLTDPVVTVGMYDPGSIRIHGRIHNLFAGATWDAQLQVDNLNLERFVLYCPPIVVQHGQGRVHGDFGRYIGQVDADVNWNDLGLDQLKLHVDLDGDGTGIVFNEVQVTRLDGSVDASGGSINWKELFAWEAAVRVDKFDLSTVAPGVTGKLSGELASVGNVTDDDLSIFFDVSRVEGDVEDIPLAGHGRVNLNMTGVSTRGFTLTSDLFDGQVVVRNSYLHWDEPLDWGATVLLENINPGSFFENDKNLPAMQGRVDGLLSGSGRLGGDTMLTELSIVELTGNLGKKSVGGSGKLRLEGDELESSGLSVTIGSTVASLAGKLGVTSSDNDKFTLKYSLSSEDLSELPGGAKGELHCAGTIGGTASLPELNGNCTGKELAWQDYGATEVQLAVQATVPAQERSGQEKSTVKSRGISGEYGKRPLMIKGHASGLQLGNARMSQIDIAVKGTAAVHRMELSAEQELAAISLQLSGGLSGSRSRPEWRGNINALQMNTEEYGRFLQTGNASLTADVKKVRLEDFCVSDRSGSVCLDGTLGYAGEPDWSANIHVNQLPLNWLNRLEVIDQHIVGRLTGQASASGSFTRLRSGSGAFHTEGFATEVDLGNNNTVHLFGLESSVDFKLENKVFDTTASIAMHRNSGVQKGRLKNEGPGAAGTSAGSPDKPAGGSLRAHLRLAKVDRLSELLRSTMLSGSVQLENFDTGLLEPFMEHQVEPSGMLNGSLDVQGGLASARYKGAFSLDDGGLYITQTGVNFSDVILRLSGELPRIHFTANADSGAGLLSAEGDISLGGGAVNGSIRAAGSDVLLVELPEYVFRASPDINLNFNGNKATLSGNVLVPYGRITPEEFVGSVSSSEDVVFVDDGKELKKQSWPLYLDVGVVVGSDVLIKGYGLNGRLTGRLDVRTTSDAFLTGKGELDLVDGNYSIYGRTLDIERGRVLFNGGPIENPGLDVRAQKVVSDADAKDGKGYTVGVDISGLAQDLHFQLFSDPFMEDTEILSFMVVGHSLSDSSSEEESTLLRQAAESLGMSTGAKLFETIGSVLQLDDLHLEGSRKNQDVSLVVGKKVTKDLYIGYDVNMFNQQSEFRVRYDLSKGFWVETRSSSEATGADLLYSFER